MCLRRGLEPNALVLSTWCFIWLILLGCAPRDNPVIRGDNRVITGTTMGTYFKVETVCDQVPIEAEIVAELDRLTLIFSTYRDDSEITQLNDDVTGEWLSIGPDMLSVAMHARRMFVASHGAFDPTVSPYLELWGFGNEEVAAVPDPRAMDAVRPKVGYSLIEIRDVPPSLRKYQVDVRLDFSASAKGYSVDRVAELIETQACTNYLVDIGGDVRFAGVNSNGEAWRIGIENPMEPSEVLGYLASHDGAVATSGTYMNTRTFDDAIYNHLIDPRSGRPIRSQLLAVSVFADDAISADAWATALIVAGSEESRALARRFNLSALFMARDFEGGVETEVMGEFESFVRSY